MSAGDESENEVFESQFYLTRKRDRETEAPLNPNAGGLTGGLVTVLDVAGRRRLCA
jgi:hypothetical protein